MKTLLLTWATIAALFFSLLPGAFAQTPNALSEGPVQEILDKSRLTDRAAPPTEGPLRVSVGIWAIDVNSIDSAEQKFRANIFLTLRWKDERLAHEEDGLVFKAVNEAWTPRALIANDTGNISHTLPEGISVENDGTAVYRQRLVGSFAQRLDLAHFPFDSHSFHIHILLPTLPAAEVEFVPETRMEARGLIGAVGMDDEISLPDWRVLGFDAGPEPYVLLPEYEVAGYSFRFRAARQTKYWIWKVILPLTLIVAMSWSVFWIDPSNSGSQIGVATTVMLTLIAYRFAIEARIPPVSYMTRLDWFISASTVLVFLTLIEALVTTNLAREGRGALAATIDRVSRVLFPVAFGAVMLVSFVD